MPRKKPTELKSAAPAAAPAPKTSAPAPVSAPVVAAATTPSMVTNSALHPADTNGDGKVSTEEHNMYLEFRRKELEDMDAMRDAQRNMTWFALFGLLLYPFAVVVTSLLGLSEATKTLGGMAPTYFVAVAGIVAAFFGAQAYSKKNK
jgi:hypothetical protein